MGIAGDRALRHQKPMMHITSTLLSFVVALVAASSDVFASIAPGPIVDLGYARYTGSFNATTNTTNYLGIRYAAPPIGRYRQCLMTYG